MTRFRPLLLLAIFLPAAAAPAVNEWMVILSEPAAVERFPGRIEQTRAASEGYRQHLREAQRAVRSQFNSLHIPVTGSVQHLMNGVFIRATPDQIGLLKTLPGVMEVVPLRRYHTNDQLSLSNVQQAWSNAAIGGQNNAGKGLKIAILDTGIDQTHPSFQDSSLTPPPGFPKCDVPANCAFTNNKVIVARSYVSTLTAGSSSADPAADSRPDDLSARDFDGHGTAVASVAAGITTTVGGTPLSGVAPKAFLGSYKIYGSPEVNNGASDAGIIQALEDAILDGMDVVNLSSGSPPTGGPLDTGATCGLSAGQPCDPSAAAIESAMKNSQTIVVVSAGNEGSTGYQSIANNKATYGTIGTPAYTPSAIAAGGIQNDVGYVLSVGIAGPSVPSNLMSLQAFPSGDGPTPSSTITAPLVDVAQAGNDPLLCTAPAAGSLSGRIALILRGTCNFSMKVDNAQVGGALGVIFINNSSDPATLSGWGGLATTTIPAEMLSQSDGQALKSYVDGHSGVTATLSPTPYQVSAATLGFVPDTTAYFASRGPATGSYGLKPDVSAAATNFLLAAENVDNAGDLYSANRYATADGTSFSSPAIAGAAALVKQANPGLTALQVKSALVNTATLNNILNQDGNGPAAIADVGSGLLQAQNAVVSPVTFLPSAISFGLLTGSLPAAQPVTVTNTGRSPVTLNFSVNATAAATATQVRVNGGNNATLTLAAGQSSTLSVSLSGNVPTAGRYEGVIVATGASVPLHIPYLFVVGGGSPYDMIPIFGDGFDGPVGQPIPNDLGGGLLIRVVDQFGVAVANTPVQWTVVRGGGRVVTGSQNTDTTTDQNGLAFATVHLGNGSGTQSFKATVANGVSYTFQGFARVPPSINSGGIVDGASFTGGRAVAPGSIISIFGSNLADGASSASLVPLSRGIGGTAFSFDIPSAGVSLPGYFFYVSPTQINLQVPWELANYSSATVKTIVNFTYSGESTLQLATYSPGFFSYQSGSNILAAALDGSNKLVGPSNAVARGGVVQFYMNGLGPVNNQPADGAAAADASSTTKAVPSITIGGQTAQVSFSGLAPNFVGLYQVNAVVPTGIAAGVQPVTCTIGGVSCKTVSLNVQ